MGKPSSSLRESQRPYAFALRKYKQKLILAFFSERALALQLRHCLSFLAKGL
jgi:hypothetical protein